MAGRRSTGSCVALVPSALVLAACAGVAPDAATDDRVAPGSPTILPLEVIAAAPPAEVEIELMLAAAELELATDAALALELHNVVESDSAYVQVNDAEPIDLGAAASPWLSRAGNVTAGRIELDRSTLVAGSNRLRFRYTRQVPNVSGYRVLAVAIELDGEPASALQGEWEDPAAWSPIHAGADAIERGRHYFQDVSRDGGPACARCHADSGADLQYFGFSNHGIVERSRFHEFSRQEAEEIASYLRSLDVPRDGVIYDAPFQPGAQNRGARGAGRGAVLSDAGLCEAAFGAPELPADLAWDWAADVDTYRLAATVAVPTWFRWLPRELSDHWFELEVSVQGTRRTLRDVERALAEQGTQQAAEQFMAVAVSAGERLLVEENDHRGRIDLLRFAAVKLWDWSRRNDFDANEHGFPDRAPAYPYEVGFAFFEAALADEPIADAMDQVLQWWWAQLAVHPGRGLSNGLRPLNYRDVLLVAESADAGPCAIAFLHLLGSWEESRGASAGLWGSDRGPARLLEVPMRRLDARGREIVMRRFLREESARIEDGATLAPEHHTQLASGWAAGCEQLEPAQRSSLRALAHPDVSADLAACP